MNKLFKCLTAVLLTLVLSFSQIGVAALADNETTTSTTTTSTTTTSSIKTTSAALPYFYYQLSDIEKSAYKKLYTAIRDHKKEVKLGVQLNDDQLNNIAWIAFIYDANIFDLDDLSSKTTKSETIIRIKYEYSTDTYTKMKAKLEKRADQIIAKLTDKMSTYQKVKIIHDEIINNCEYVLQGQEFDSAYGALVNKKAKCTGYAHAFAYVCNRAGIKTAFVIGDDGTHIWNMVYINKKWYHIDLTWDDPVSNFTQNTTYNYFLLSDKQITETQKIDDNDFEIPTAADDSLSYYVKNKLVADDAGSASEILTNEIAKAIKSQKSLVSIKCSSKEAYQEINDYLINQEELFNIYKNAGKQSGKSFCDELIYYSFNENTYIMTFALFYPNTKISYYFTDTSGLDSATLNELKHYGIK